MLMRKQSETKTIHAMLLLCCANWRIFVQDNDADLQADSNELPACHSSNANKSL